MLEDVTSIGHNAFCGDIMPESIFCRIEISYKIERKRSLEYMKEQHITVSGNIVDVLKPEVYPGTIHIFDGRIAEIIRENRDYKTYIIPGFIDAHLHIESSMLVPSELARVAVIHGTVATVSDPHEIANVLGREGVKYMIEDAGKSQLKFYFGVPSCVPATRFETSGASINPKDVNQNEFT